MLGFQNKILTTEDIGDYRLYPITVGAYEFNTFISGFCPTDEVHLFTTAVAGTFPGILVTETTK
jgi:hypothetical protein